MWVQSGNDSSFLTRNPPWITLLLESTALIVPVLPLLPFRSDLIFSFPTGIFLAGVALEFLVSQFIHFLHWKRLVKSKYCSGMNYINRMTVGLPLTVLYSIGSPYGFLALFRLVPATILIFRENKRAAAYSYSTFFLTGSIFASMMNGSGLGEEDLITIVFLSGICFLVVGLLSVLKQQRFEYLRTIRRLRIRERKK